jgi:hypothetical protein
VPSGRNIKIYFRKGTETSLKETTPGSNSLSRKDFILKAAIVKKHFEILELLF